MRACLALLRRVPCPSRTTFLAFIALLAVFVGGALWAAPDADERRLLETLRTNADVRDTARALRARVLTRFVRAARPDEVRPKLASAAERRAPFCEAFLAEASQAAARGEERWGEGSQAWQTCAVMRVLDRSGAAVAGKRILTSHFAGPLAAALAARGATVDVAAPRLPASHPRRGELDALLARAGAPPLPADAATSTVAGVAITAGGKRSGVRTVPIAGKVLLASDLADILRIAGGNATAAALAPQYDAVVTIGMGSFEVNNVGMASEFFAATFNALRPGGVSVHTVPFVVSHSFDTFESPDPYEQKGHFYLAENDARRIVSEGRALGFDIPDPDFCAGSDAEDFEVDVPPFARGFPSLKRMYGTTEYHGVYSDWLVFGTRRAA